MTRGSRRPLPSGIVASVRLLPLLALTACFGLETVPDPKSDGADLDSGVPLDTGDPIDSAGDGNRAPVADAGDDDEVGVGEVVGLDGGGSHDPDGDPITYDWRFVTRPGSSSASLVDDERADPQFVPDVPGRYELGLVVSDGALESAEDTVEITVTEPNGGPVANAGRDQYVTEGDLVGLDGSGSSDPDGDALQYAWTLVTRPSGSSATLTSSTSDSPRFTADVAGTYTISLTVSDGAETSAPDEVVVTAEPFEDTGGGGDSGCGCRSGGAGDALGTALLVALAGLANRRRALR